MGRVGECGAWVPVLWDLRHRLPCLRHDARAVRVGERRCVRVSFLSAFRVIASGGDVGDDPLQRQICADRLRLRAFVQFYTVGGAPRLNRFRSIRFYKCFTEKRLICRFFVFDKIYLIFPRGFGTILRNNRQKNQSFGEEK